MGLHEPHWTQSTACVDVFVWAPEMAYSPLGDATVMAEAFPMLSMGPRPTWLLKLNTCQPMTLASCCTAWTWCCDICTNTHRSSAPHQEVSLVCLFSRAWVPETAGSPAAPAPGVRAWWRGRPGAPLGSAPHRCSAAAGLIWEHEEMIKVHRLLNQGFVRILSNYITGLFKLHFFSFQRL